MRLLHKKTLKLHWFTTNPPGYIILSHRWLGAETTLQQFQLECQKPESKQSPGTRKVIRFCAEISDKPEEYVWVDTICIDKTSSTELQEAINSMYSWYQLAKLCLVYLDDVGGDKAEKKHGEVEGKRKCKGQRESKGEGKSEVMLAKRKALEERLEKSIWFTRGWTLQELIAPRLLVFVDADWHLIGSRHDFAETIQRITHIPMECLGYTREVHRLPVATRMGWLARRETTREEDLAYCMLGIFGINMPMLYGEGARAFKRLQKELMEELEDESILLWTLTEEEMLIQDLSRLAITGGQPNSILAPRPSCFAGISNKQLELDHWFDREPPRVTSKGLSLEVWDQRDAQFEEKLTVPLNVKLDGRRACLELTSLGHKKNPEKADNTRWARNRMTEIITVEEGKRKRPPTAREEFDRHLQRAQMEEQAQRSEARSRLNMTPVDPNQASMDAWRTISGMSNRHQRMVPGYNPTPEFGTARYQRFYSEQEIGFQVFVE